MNWKINLIIIFICVLNINTSLFAQSGTTCNNVIDIDCGFGGTFNTKNGINSLTRLDYGSCVTTQSQFNARELLFKLVKTGNKTWHISINNRNNIDLDMFLFKECPLFGTGDGELTTVNAVPCSEKSTNGYDSPFSGYNFDVISIKIPGTYWIVVDGFNSAHEGAFTIDVGCDELWDDVCNSTTNDLKCGMQVNGTNGSVGCNCPPNVICTCLLFSSRINWYNCFPSNSRGSLNGYENIYKFTAPTSGEYTFDLTSFTSDLEMFLISNLCTAPNSVSGTGSVYNCVAQSINSPGVPEKITYNMFAGQTIYVVIDRSLDTGSFDNFKLSVSCPTIIPPETCDNKCCNFLNNYRECYGFENYSLGILVPQGSPKFTLFNSTASNAQVVTTNAKTGTKSIRFTNNSNIDLNINRTLTETKVARFEWSMFTPSGKSAEWGLQTNNTFIYPIIGRIRNNSIAILREVNDGVFEDKTTFPYPHNEWVKFTLIFQPFENEIELWMNGKFIYKEIAFGSNLVTKLNYYPNTQNPSSTEFFIDDICYSEAEINLPCTLNIDPVCVNGKEYQNGCLAQRAGYTNCEWTAGACSAICMNCWNCFHYLQAEADPLTYQFINRYCGQGYIGLNDDRTNNRSVNNLIFEWNVENTNVTFTNNTNKNSIDPFIKFPGVGAYTVCLKVFEPGTTTPVYTCCLTVIVNQNCLSKPVAHFSYTANPSDNSFTLNSSRATEGGDILWDFGGQPVTYLNNTNKNSSSPRISIPEGACIDVCFSLSNSCGISTYCVTLCRNNSSCSGNVPEYTIVNRIEPIITDETVSFTNLPTPPSGTNVEYIWDFGDGVGKSSLKNPVYKYPKKGSYLVCLTIKLGCKKICYCWCVYINPCPLLFEPHAGMLRPRFGGNETTLQYTIESNNITVAPNQPWLVDDVPMTSSSGAANLTIALPQNRDYTICFPYLKPNGCLAYKCITIRGGNPFSCTSIGWKYVQNSGYQFALPFGFSDISWTLDETGQNIGTSATSNFVSPVTPCGWRTISVRYFDGTRYWICCMRIYLCAADDCFDNIYYGFSNDNGQFRLEESGATNISWYFDDAPNTILGSASTINIPYPTNCVTRLISVKFRDASGRWRICCRLIYFCNPFNCDLIKLNYVDGSGYKFSLDQSYQNMSWIIDETSESLGSGLESSFYPVPATCGYRTVSVRFFVPGLGWRMCCYRFWWCNPNVCSDRINIAQSGSNFTLSTTSSFQNITWFRDNVQLGTGNNLTTALPSTGSYKIYVRYYNPADKSWYWCCKQSNPCAPVFEPHDGMLRPRFGGNETTLQYTIESNNITIAPGQPWVVDDVPVTSSSGAGNLTIALSQNRDYTICFPYLKPNGCLAYKCITIRGGNPFSCTNIGWKFVQNSGYQFSLPAGFSEINWTLDEAGQNIGTSATSNFVLPVNPCGWRTISVRYFDGTRYWICCLRIYLCAPDDCFDNIYYGFSNDNGQFRLEESGATNISWYFDDVPNNTLGTTSTISVPYPENCITRWISVKFKDASGRWRVCCRLIYFCNPFNCDLIKLNYVDGSGYKFSLDQSYQNMSWIIDETSESLGSGLESSFYPVPATCGYRTVSVRFFVPGLGWRMCCYRFWWCNPNLCNDRITINQAGTNYTLSTTSSFQNITWFRDNVQLGTGNNLSTALPSTGSYKIYVRYYNPEDKSWYWCCRTYTVGGNQNDLTIDIDDNICGGQNADIEVPVRVKKYSKISGLQLKIASSDNNIAEVTGVTNVNPGSGLSNIDFAVVDKKLVLTYADSDKTLSDSAILFSVKVKLKGAINSKADLVFEGNLKALDANGGTLNVNGVKGSVCILQPLLSLAGRITNTTDKGIPNVNVNVTTGNNQVTTKKTGSTGLYTIPDLMSGANFRVKPAYTETLSNGVDISDLFILRRHMQGLSLFSSPYTYLAADLNKDKLIDISDLFLLRRIMQGLTTELPNSEPAWRFVPKSYVFPNTGNPLEGTIPDALEYNPLTAIQSNQHYIGVKYGDLDHSLISVIAKIVENRSAADVELTTGSLVATSGSTVSLEVKSKNFISGAVMQFSIQWPTDKLGLANLPTGSDIGLPGTTIFDQTQLAQGKLGFIWETDNFGSGTTLADNSTVFRLKFKVLGPNNSSLKVENSIMPKVSKFLDVNGAEIPLKINAGTVTIALPSSTLSQRLDKSIKVFPNPTNGIIIFETDEQDFNNLEIRSLDGKLMLHVPELKDNTIDASHLLPGIYLLKGNAANISFTKKLVIVK